MFLSSLLSVSRDTWFDSSSMADSHVIFVVDLFDDQMLRQEAQAEAQYYGAEVDVSHFRGIMLVST